MARPRKGTRGQDPWRPGALDLETTRSVLLQVRLTTWDKATLAQAARTMKQTLSDFVRSTAVNAAEAVLASTGQMTAAQAEASKGAEGEAVPQTRKVYEPRKHKR